MTRLSMGDRIIARMLTLLLLPPPAPAVAQAPPASQPAERASANKAVRKPGCCRPVASRSAINSNYRREYERLGMPVLALFVERFFPISGTDTVWDRRTREWHAGSLRPGPCRGGAAVP